MKHTVLVVIKVWKNLMKERMHKNSCISLTIKGQAYMYRYHRFIWSVAIGVLKRMPCNYTLWVVISGTSKSKRRYNKPEILPLIYWIFTHSANYNVVLLMRLIILFTHNLLRALSLKKLQIRLVRLKKFCKTCVLLVPWTV